MSRNSIFSIASPKVAGSVVVAATLGFTAPAARAQTTQMSSNYWFTPMASDECIRSGVAAIGQVGGQAKPGVNGYGLGWIGANVSGYVVQVWCMTSKNTVAIIVAGPDAAMANRTLTLIKEMMTQPSGPPQVPSKPPVVTGPTIPSLPATGGATSCQRFPTLC